MSSNKDSLTCDAGPYLAATGPYSCTEKMMMMHHHRGQIIRSSKRCPRRGKRCFRMWKCPWRLGRRAVHNSRSRDSKCESARGRSMNFIINGLRRQSLQTLLVGGSWSICGILFLGWIRFSESYLPTPTPSPCGDGERKGEVAD